MVNKDMELPEVRSMLYIPEKAVEITLTAKVYHNGELISFSKTLDLQEIRRAIADAENNYFEDDDVFCLTEKGANLADN